MTFTFDLETRFKVNAHSLPKSSVYLKCGPDRAGERKYNILLWTKIFKVAWVWARLGQKKNEIMLQMFQTDSRMGQTDH